MSKAFDEIMKVIQEKGEIPDEKAKEIIKEHGALSDDEKKQIAAAIKMKKALSDEGGKDIGDVSMEDYINALSVLDSDAATEEDKKKAQAIKDKFESQ